MVIYECNIPTWILADPFQRLKLQLSKLLKSRKKGTDLFSPFLYRNFCRSQRENRSVPFFLRSAGGKNQSPFSAWWWSQAGSNRRPPACKAGALPAELWPPRLVGLGRVELPTSPLSGVRSNQLSYRPGLLENARSDNMCERLRRLGIQR